MQQNIETRLWDYIDGNASAEERTVIELLIRENAEWKAKYNEVLETHQWMQQVDLEEPSMRFTRNVMEEIAKYKIAPATKTYINGRIIWGIGGFFIAMIVGLIIYVVGQIQWDAAGTTNLPVDLSKVNESVTNVSSWYNSSYVTVFIMVNIVLGFVLLDRYLTNKKKKLE